MTTIHIIHDVIFVHSTNSYGSNFSLAFHRCDHPFIVLTYRWKLDYFNTTIRSIIKLGQYEVLREVSYAIASYDEQNNIISCTYINHWSPYSIIAVQEKILPDCQKWNISKLVVRSTIDTTLNSEDYPSKAIKM